MQNSNKAAENTRAIDRNLVYNRCLMEDSKLLDKDNMPRIES